MQSFQIFIFVPIDTMLECRSEVCGREKKITDWTSQCRRDISDDGLTD